MSSVATANSRDKGEKPVSTVPAIELRGLGKTFVTEEQGRVVALHNIDLTIEKNSFVVIVGPSGCGKSTILNLIAGLMEPTHGEVYCNGVRVRGINTNVGYVTQESKLFPWMTLEENVTFALNARRVPKDEQKRLVKEYLAMVGLSGFERHYPYQLSGGMQKRASLVRTLIYDPDIIMMDEPFGALDAQTRMIMQQELLTIWEKRKKTIVFVTHDLVEAIALADRVVVLTNRPSTVRAVIDVPLARPRNVFEIHTAEGFDEVYNELWQIFRHELKLKNSA